MSCSLIFLAYRPDFHLCEFQGVLPACPGGPLDAVCVGRVLAAEVLPIQVGHVAVPVPPGSVVEGGAVVLRVIVVLVLGSKLHAVVFEQ